MYLGKKIEDCRFTYKLTLQKELLLKEKQAIEKKQQEAAENQEKIEEENMTIQIVPVCYSETMPLKVRQRRKPKDDSRVNDSQIIMLKRHYNVPKRNLNVHEFFKAIYQGNLNAVIYYLRFVSIKSVDPADGMTPLMACMFISSKKKRDEVFQYLLRHGAVLSGQDDKMARDLIAWASFHGRSDELAEIIDKTSKEIDYHRRDKQSYTYLHLAVLSGNLPTVVTLIDNMKKTGTSVDITDSDGLTPYILARKMGHSEIANELQIRGKASPNKNDELSFRSPREWSQIGKFERIQEKSRKFWTGEAGLVPLNEMYEANDLRMAPRNEEVSFVNLAKHYSPRRSTSQDLVHHAFDIWADQHLPGFRKPVAKRVVMQPDSAQLSDTKSSKYSHRHANRRGRKPRHSGDT